MQVAVFAPAKLNLFLAITGRRSDGFHSLVSLVSPLSSGDLLWAETAPSCLSDSTADSLSCDDPSIPADGSNLVLKAAAAFRTATGWSTPVHFSLKKHTPHGAGLGGGSSDAVAALRALNLLAGHPLDHGALVSVAAQIGSDCPLFLADGPVVMRGRGECVSPLSLSDAKRLRGRRVLVFKPDFGISTAWSYGQLAAAAPASYLPDARAEARLADWFASSAPAEDLLFNSMEVPAFRKFVALPALLDQLRADFGLRPAMSGSGSACFAFLSEDQPSAPVISAIRDAWGENAFVLDARLA